MRWPVPAPASHVDRPGAHCRGGGQGAGSGCGRSGATAGVPTQRGRWICRCRHGNTRRRRVAARLPAGCRCRGDGPPARLRNRRRRSGCDPHRRRAAQGADAVAMIEHTADLGDGRIELSRALAVGDNVIKPGDDVAEGAPIATPADTFGHRRSACWRPPGSPRSTSTTCLWWRSSRPATRSCRPIRNRHPGVCVTRTRTRWRRWCTSWADDPWMLGIVPDDPGDLERACRIALDRADVLVVSAGSSVGMRDATATVMSRLGSPGIWCHGLALKPGKPTLLADLDGRPAIGLPGNPVSALVVMRLVGGPVIVRAGGSTETDRGRRTRRCSSATCRPRPAGWTSFRCGWTAAGRCRCSERRRSSRS